MTKPRREQFLRGFFILNPNFALLAQKGSQK